MKRSLQELIKRADSIADEFENYEPTDDDFDVPLSPLLAVRLAAWRRDAAEKELAVAIRMARAEEVSWRKLGAAIGTTGEAVRQRYANV